jgi:hypothetical protein
LASSFAQFSKDASSALEDLKLNRSGSNSIFTHSNPLDCLEYKGFEALPYWFRGPWFDAKHGKVAVETEEAVLVLFCEDKNGAIQPKSEIKAVRSFMKAYFEFLWDKRKAPTCWGNAPLHLRVDFVRKMEEEFGWLRYCHRHWKAEQLFMNYYPQWYKTKVKPRKSTKRKAHPGDDDDNDDVEEDPNGSKRARVVEPKPTPLPVRPVSTGVSTTRGRVRSPAHSTFLSVNSLQNNPDPSGSRHARVEEPAPTPPPTQPVATGVSTTRKRVRSLFHLISYVLTTSRIIHCKKAVIICVRVTHCLSHRRSGVRVLMSPSVLSTVRFFVS